MTGLSYPLPARRQSQHSEWQNKSTRLHSLQHLPGKMTWLNCGRYQTRRSELFLKWQLRQ